MDVDGLTLPIRMNFELINRMAYRLPRAVSTTIIGIFAFLGVDMPNMVIIYRGLGMDHGHEFSIRELSSDRIWIKEFGW